MNEPRVPVPPPSSRSSLPPDTSAPLLSTRRHLHVIGALTIAMTAVGFFTGIAQQRGEAPVRAVEAGGEAVVAPGYAQLRSETRGPNAALHRGAFDALTGALPSPLASVPPQTEAQRALVLASRADKRAYDGAPPVIPHVVASRATTECLACHEKGALIEGKRAPRMSHGRHESCTQCHVAADGPRSEPAPPLAENTFVGAGPVAMGERAWNGAPPVIPHGTWMRSECGSCHGVAGALGMRSTHPWRESCQQCHPPSAALDHRADGREPGRNYE